MCSLFQLRAQGSNSKLYVDVHILRILLYLPYCEKTTQHYGVITTQLLVNTGPGISDYYAIIVPSVPYRSIPVLLRTP